MDAAADAPRDVYPDAPGRPDAPPPDVPRDVPLDVGARFEEPDPACGIVCGELSAAGAGSDRIMNFDNLGNVAISPGIQSRLGTAFQIDVTNCCEGSDLGVTAVLQLEGPTGAPRSRVLFGPNAREFNRQYVSTPFYLDGRLAVIGAPDFDEVAQLDEDELSVSATVDVSALELEAANNSAPTFAKTDEGFLVLHATNPVRARRLDPELAPIDAEITYDFDVFDAVLVRVCDGIVALLRTREYDLYTLAFDTAGNALADVPTLQDPDVRRGLNALWDGQAIVVTDGARVLELDASGTLTAETPTENVSLAAAGTSMGLVTVETDPMSPLQQPSVLVRERETGALIVDLGFVRTNGYGSDAGIAVAPGRLDVVAASFATRDSATTRTFECATP